MAKTSSAKKANRVSRRKYVVNLRRKRIVRETLKVHATTKNAVTLSSTQQAIDKAVKLGLIKKNTASRMKSRASRVVAK